MEANFSKRNVIVLKMIRALAASLSFYYSDAAKKWMKAVHQEE